MAGDANVLPEIRRKSGFTRATFEVSDTLSIYADALYANIDAYSDSAYAVRIARRSRFARDNAFPAGAVRNIMIANTASQFCMGRIVEEGRATNTTVDNTVQRYGSRHRGQLRRRLASWDAVGAAEPQRLPPRGRQQPEHCAAMASASTRSSIPATNQPICRALAQRADQHRSRHRQLRSHQYLRRRIDQPGSAELFPRRGGAGLAAGTDAWSASILNGSVFQLPGRARRLAGSRRRVSRRRDRCHVRCGVAGERLVRREPQAAVGQGRCERGLHRSGRAAAR